MNTDELEAEVQRLTADNADLSEKVLAGHFTQAKLRSELAKAKTARQLEITDLMTREQYWRQAAADAMEISTAREALMNSGEWCERVTKLQKDLDAERKSLERIQAALSRTEGRAERNWELYERTRGVLEELLSSVASAKREYYQEAFTPKTNS